MNLKKLFKIIAIACTAVVFVMCFLFFIHDDLMETANHSYMLLTDIEAGRFFDFYLDVEAHNNDLYYINSANYNILVYLFFALWQLPLQVLSFVFRFTLREQILWMWSKVLPCVFYLLCALEVKNISVIVSNDLNEGRKNAIVFLVSPVAFFSAFIMGQYVTICLFFMLLFIRLMEEDIGAKAIIVGGIAICLNLMTFFVIIPYLLLKTEAINKSFIANLLLLFTPFLVTKLLFLGKEGHSKFASEMIRRIMTPLVVGNVEIPVFPCILTVLCCVSLLMTDERNIHYGIRISLLSLAALFLLIEWHPQWIILLIAIISINMECNERVKALWPVLSVMLSIGFYLYSFCRFPGQLENNLLNDSFSFVSLIDFPEQGMLFSEMLTIIDSDIPVRMIAKALFSAVLVSLIFFSWPGKQIISSTKTQNIANYRVCYAVITFFAAIISYTVCIFMPFIFAR